MTTNAEGNVTKETMRYDRRKESIIFFGGLVWWSLALNGHWVFAVIWLALSLGAIKMLPKPWGPSSSSTSKQPSQEQSSS